MISLLSTRLTTSSSSLSVVNTSASPPSSFTLDIVMDSSGALSSVSVGGDSSLFTVSGNSIIGASGTDYAGIAFTYSGSTSQSITVTSTIGIASLLNTVAANASNNTNGTLQTLISDLETQDNTLQEKADAINSAASTYEANLKVRIRAVSGRDPIRQLDVGLSRSPPELERLTMSPSTNQFAAQAYRNASVAVPPLQAMVMLFDGAILSCANRSRRPSSAGSRTATTI